MNRNNYSITRNLIFETTMSLNNNERVLTHPFNWVFLVTIHIYPQFKKNSSRKKNGLSAMNDVIKSTSQYIFKQSFVLKNPFIICIPFCSLSVDIMKKESCLNSLFIPLRIKPLCDFRIFFTPEYFRIFLWFFFN